MNCSVEWKKGYSMGIAVPVSVGAFLNRT